MLEGSTEQSHENLQDFDCTLSFYVYIDVTSKCIIVADITLVGEQ
jgi:hypothetical protein